MLSLPLVVRCRRRWSRLLRGLVVIVVVMVREVLVLLWLLPGAQRTRS